MNDVVSIEYKGGFVYRVVFDDGKSGDIDFSEYVGKGPVFEPLRDTAFFKKATVEGGTIAWPKFRFAAPKGCAPRPLRKPRRLLSAIASKRGKKKENADTN